MDNENLAKFNEYQQFKRDKIRRDQLYNELYELNKQKYFIDKSIAKLSKELDDVCDRIDEYEQGTNSETNVEDIQATLA